MRGVRTRSKWEVWSMRLSDGRGKNKIRARSKQEMLSRRQSNGLVGDVV